MTITPFQSKTNNTFPMKKATVATLIGAVALGGKEVYNTRRNLLDQKDSYRAILSGYNMHSEKTNECLKKLDEKELAFAKELGNMMPIPNTYEKDVKTNIDNFYKKQKQILVDLKNHYKEEIKNIKKAAPRKIALKALGGAGLVLGVFLGKHIIDNKN